MKRLVCATLLCAAVFPAARPAVAETSEDFVLANRPGDYATALKFFLPLAGQGNAAAQNAVGVMYASGYEIPKDHVQAHMWLSLSASLSGGEAGSGYIEALAAQMTPAEIAEAERLAQAWRRKSQ